MLGVRPKTTALVLGLFVALGLVDLFLRFGGIPSNQLLCNPGIALGVRLPAPILWSGIGFMLAFGLWFAWAAGTILTRLAWVAIVVGGSVNALDRLLRGCITDYLNIPFFPSFNLADIMLFLGVALLLTLTLGIFPKTEPYVR